MIMMTPTANFRLARRLVQPEDEDASRIQDVPQQQFVVTHGQGSTKERTRFVWLDCDHDMFVKSETGEEANARLEIEEAWAKHGNAGVRINRP